MDQVLIRRLLLAFLPRFMVRVSIRNDPIRHFTPDSPTKCPLERFLHTFPSKTTYQMSISAILSDITTQNHLPKIPHHLPRTHFNPKLLTKSPLTHPKPTSRIKTKSKRYRITIPIIKRPSSESRVGLFLHYYLPFFIAASTKP